MAERLSSATLATLAALAAAPDLAAAPTVRAGSNDECATAIAVNLGSTVFDNTSAATSSDPGLCNANFSKDLWFTYTATSSADVTIDTCGSSFDTVIELFTGSCGALSYQFCNDDSCSTQSSITVTGLTAGLTLVIRIGGYNGASGAGTLNVTKVVARRGLFISEYVEGSQNNKAVEIYNGTAETIDLSQYQLRCYNNGNLSPNNTSTLSGTLAPYGTAVYIPTSGNTSSVEADLSSRGISWGTATAINFNGDDAVALTDLSGAYLDVVGEVGFDPGTRWGSGGITTQNDTLRRRPTVAVGDEVASDNFDPSAEFDGFPQNAFSDLGQHAGPIDVSVPCDTTANSGGSSATLAASGSRSVGDNDLSLTVSGLPTTGTTAFVFNAFLAPGQSLTTAFHPTPGGGPASAGDVCIAGGTFGRHVFGSDIYIGTGGTFSISVDLTDVPSPRDGNPWPNAYSTSVLAGETWYWQCWYRDPSAGTGASNFSEAIGITFQ